MPIAFSLAMAKRRASAIPWWLTGAEETCFECGQPYAFGVGIRCIDCDRELCPVCFVWIETERVCRECDAPSESKRRRTPWRRGRSGKR